MRNENCGTEMTNIEIKMDFKGELMCLSIKMGTINVDHEGIKETSCEKKS